MQKVVLYIDSMSRGGAQRVIKNIAEYLSNKCEVILVNDTIFDAESEYTIDSSVKRIDLNLIAGGLVGNFKRMRKLRAIIRTEKPDIVLSFLGPCNIRMLLATISLKVKKYVSVRNDPYYEYGRGIRKFLFRQIFKLATGCVFQTKDARAYFPEKVQKKSTIIWNPVDNKFYENDWCCKRNEIAVVGRLQLQKNPILAVTAFALIAHKYPDMKLVFYGDGELKAEILNKAKEYGLEGRITIFGNIENIEKFISSAKVFLMTSDFEGLPNALMEAMAIGIPCVATDCPCGGPRDLTEGFNEMLLVPCNDANAIAQRLDEVLSNEALQTAMSQEEKNRAKKFHINAIMKKWESFMEKVL